MLLQNLHCRYLYITIKLPHLSDLEQRIPDFPNCDNYGSLHASNSDPLLIIHQQMIMNYIRLSVILSKLIIFKKWMSLLNYETD